MPHSSDKTSSAGQASLSTNLFGSNLGLEVCFLYLLFNFFRGVAGVSRIQHKRKE